MNVAQPEAVCLPEPLTQEQLEAFKNDGYLVINGLLSDADLEPVIAEINEEIDRRAAVSKAEGKLSQLYEELSFKKRLVAITEETPEIANAIWNGNLNGPAIFNFIRNPKLLDVAEQFCGPELIASSVYRLRPKVPRHHKSAVPWHQDSGYMEPFCDKALVVTMWIPLVDAHEENGCLWVISGGHRAPVVRHRHHESGYLTIDEAHLPNGNKVCVPVKKGGILLLHNRTPHASFENSSEDVRWSMDLRYQSAALPTNADITRLEGEATQGPDSDVPVACYPPEADFLVRSQRRPNEVVRDAGTFHALREKHIKRPVTARWRTES